MKFYLIIILLFNSVLTSAQETEIDKIIDRVAREDLTTIEEVLELLPDDLRDNYILQFDTQNTMIPADFESPRIIMFSSDGRTQVSISGQEKGKNLFEVIQMNDE
jgi:hypothetical protein